MVSVPDAPHGGTAREPVLHCHCSAARVAVPFPAGPEASAELLMSDTRAFLRVTEIFHSIQGESSWAGFPCTFIRLTGCPLRCVWCDTEYAFHGGEQVALDDIIA